MVPLHLLTVSSIGYIGILPKGSSVMLRDIQHISSAWLLSCGQQQLPLLFTEQLLDIRRMLKIWSQCFIYMFGVSFY